MNDRIVNPIAPDLLDPHTHAPLAGDWKDDDAQVYEADFAYMDDGPQTSKGLPHVVETLKVTTRMLHRTGTVGTVSTILADPIMLMPADPNRKSLSVNIVALAAPGAGTTVVFGDSKSDCYNNGVNGYYVTNTAPTSPMINVPHTGALWAWSPTGNVAITVNAIAITE
jgi:hypothetical protein